MANGMQEQTTDQAELLAQTFPKDSLEYKLLLKYTQKKKRTNNHTPHSNGVGEAKGAPPKQPQKHRKAQKYQNRSLLKLISCIRPEKEDDDHATRPCRISAAAAVSDQEEVEQIVNKLTELTDDVQFISSDIETDSNDLVEQIVELLREQGDKLNEKIEMDHELRKQLQDSLSYSFFEKLTSSFLMRLSPEERPTTQTIKQAEIAVTFELTSRLNTMDCHPMNRVLGFGAKYLKDYFTPWVNQQGGYVKVFGTASDAEEEVH
ncbi:hypothetical protein QTP86_027504 [Hemibagrus guttatus]|nr:hypothetical protein QTP86_027504 [Hemibagrus guttatus]